MPKLYIANTTKQDVHLHFRLPGMNQIFHTFIEKGHQQQVYQEAETEILENIISQHASTPKPYCVHFSEALKVNGFIGLIYSFDKPVPGKTIGERFELNDEAMIAAAEKDRMMAAAAASGAVDKAIEGTGIKNSVLETEVIEETDPASEKEATMRATTTVQKRRR